MSIFLNFYHPYLYQETLYLCDDQFGNRLHHRADRFPFFFFFCIFFWISSFPPLFRRFTKQATCVAGKELKISSDRVVGHQVKAFASVSKAQGLSIVIIANNLAIVNVFLCVCCSQKCNFLTQLFFCFLLNCHCNLKCCPKKMKFESRIKNLFLSFSLGLILLYNRFPIKYTTCLLRYNNLLDIVYRKWFLILLCL